jgi:hypothetical protein
VSTTRSRVRVFVVDFDGEADPGQGRLVGRAEHVESGQRVHFTTSDEMNEFFARVLREVENPDRRGGSEGAVRNKHH